MSGLGALVWRDLRRAWAGGGAVLPIVFFLLVQRHLVSGLTAGGTKS